MEVKELEKGLASLEMPGTRSNNGYIYSIPMIENMEEDIYCDKRVRNIAKFAFCFIPWCALVVIFIYFGIHYDILYKTTDQCKTTLLDKTRNESISQAQIGELKQKNVDLHREVKDLKQNLEMAEAKYRNAQDKIDLYIKTIKELKETLNIKISSDFLQTTSNVNRMDSSIYLMVLGLSAVYYRFT